MVFPDFLRKEDSIAIVSPAGKVNPLYVEETAQLFREWGLNPYLGNSTLASYGRFAGKDEERLKDLQETFDRPDIKAILCSRGGYGSFRLLNRLSFKQLKKHPKWVIGYSDITALHSAIQKHGIASLHAPMCKHLSSLKEDITTLHLKEMLFGSLPDYSFPGHPLNRKGHSEGILRGGNLSILYGLRGTPYDLLPKGSVLFIEDIGEKPYQIDRMIHNLQLGGILKNISGLIVGQFTEYEEDELMKKSVYQSIADLVAEYDYPVCFNFPIGHTDKNYPVVCGSRVIFEVKDNTVELSF